MARSSIKPLPRSRFAGLLFLCLAFAAGPARAADTLRAFSVQLNISYFVNIDQKVLPGPWTAINPSSLIIVDTTTGQVVSSQITNQQGVVFPLQSMETGTFGTELDFGANNIDANGFQIGVSLSIVLPVASLVGYSGGPVTGGSEGWGAPGCFECGGGGSVTSGQMAPPAGFCPFPPFCPPPSNDAVPSVNSLTPTATAPGGAAFTLTVNGSNFVQEVLVNWNGSPRQTEFVNRNQLKATITAADILAASTASVTVTNLPPGGGTSAPLFFQVANPAPFAAVSAPLAGNPVAGTQVLADVNNDGKQDVIYVGEPIGGGGTGPTSTVSVLLGKGDGTFTQGFSYGGPGLGTGFTPALLTGDFNGDGKIDIVSLAQGLLFLGSGDGTFQPPMSLPVALQHAVVGDFNGDGKLDIVGFAPSPDGNIYILLGNGDGTFGENIDSDFITASGTYQLVALSPASIGSDGILGLIVSAVPPAGGNLFLSLVTGSGIGTLNPPAPITLNPPTGTPLLSTGPAPTAIALADLNGDGLADLLLGFGDGSLQVLLGTGNPTFGQFAPPTSLKASQPAVPGFALGDFNGDGKLDFNYGSTIFFGQGDGTFITSTSLANSPTGGNLAGDFNGDGKLDLLGPVGGVLTLALQQVTPDFTISFSGNSVASITGGQSATFGMNVTPSDGFAGNVQFSVSGLPATATATFSPNPVSGGSGSTTLTISTGFAAPGGTFHIVVSASSGGVTHSTTLVLNVTPAPLFTLSASPQQQVVALGEPAKFVGTVSFRPDFTGTVTLSPLPLPPNFTVNIEPTLVMPGAGSFKFTVSVNSKVVPGNYLIAVGGTSTSPGFTNSVTLVLVVQ